MVEIFFFIITCSSGSTALPSLYLWSIVLTVLIVGALRVVVVVFLFFSLLKVYRVTFSICASLIPMLSKLEGIESKTGRSL